MANKSRSSCRAISVLDGRNRLRACLDLNIEEALSEYTGKLPPRWLPSNSEAVLLAE
jgi:hypothetical protein